MNIKEAKEELIRTVRAYLLKDEDGAYRMDSVRQRPVLLMGPPGIGKTAVMEQVARECKVALVSYTITHHTRQSAIGLPFIREKKYGGTVYSVTEYTMSEIVASIHETMEQTGLKEGILFLDEINCVSETLAPTMLQFLQFKMFGSHRIPQGWVIAAAGNPPEYNKSVREFDIVTLDRVRTISVEDNYDVWKEYAYQRGIHPAIISYLDMKRENFYHVQTTVDGMEFVTARGWEDLSEIMAAYELLGQKTGESTVGQYIQDVKIAKDFANYLDFYEKYRVTYDMEAILTGDARAEAFAKQLKRAPFDERLSIIGLLMGSLGGLCRDVYQRDAFVGMLFGILKQEKEAVTEKDQMGGDTGAYVLGRAEEYRRQWEQKMKAGLLTKDEQYAWKNSVQKLEIYGKKLCQTPQKDSFSLIRREFQEETEQLRQQTQDVQERLEKAFSFMENAFGESQEMVIFLTELTTNFYTLNFIQENGCEAYFTYNQALLFEDRQKAILEEIKSIEGWEHL